MKSTNRLFFLTLFIHLAIPSLLRAQELPAAGASYISDSVEYNNAAGTVHLGGTLSYPASGGPFITILLISGSGQQDRDGSVMGHKPFAVIADYLTRRGYAVLRVDDRGRGKSKGELMKATSADFADDALTSIQYLLTRKEVNAKKIGVIGHSEGGLIAPILYTKWPQLAFIISLAGPSVSGAEILLKQQTDPVKTIANGMAYPDFYELTKQTLKLIHDHPSDPDSLLLEKAKQIYADWKKGKPDSILVPLRADKVTPEIYAKQQVKPQLIPWLRYFISTEPAVFWKKVKCPVLALNGEKDIQVYPEENLAGIRKYIHKKGRKKLTTRIMPGMNHLFQTCTSCTIEEYAKLKEAISPLVLEEIDRWLRQKM
jgi:uncharacterized protein